MLNAVWNILLELAPWLLVGAAVAGVLHVYLPRGFVHRQLRGRWGVVKAVGVGVPLPLCSCGVIPAGLGLKKDGAEDGAAIGFLISTPQTGVDSILVSASFLGWPFALFKVAAAAVTGVAGGWLVNATGSAEREPAMEPESVEDRPRTWRDGLDHAAMLIHSIWGWLVVGILISAAIEVWLPAGTLEGLARFGSLGAGLVALVISLPLYVCATASVPIAASLVAAGLPAGAALVFLMAGPASNVATVGAVFRGFGARTTAIYLAVIVAGSLGLGVAFDQLIGTSAGQTMAEHAHNSWWEVASAVALVVMLLVFAARDLRLRLLAGSAQAASDRSAGDEVLELNVEGLVCDGCVQKLTASLSQVDGVSGVDVSLEPGTARVVGPVARADVNRAVEDAGYRVVE